MFEHALERVAEDHQVNNRQQHTGYDRQRIASELEQIAAHYRPRFSHRKVSVSVRAGLAYQNSN
jgi:predicted component of type VI protein secretion system